MVYDLEDKEIEIEDEDLEKSREIEVFDATLRDLTVYIESGNSKLLHEKGYYGNIQNDILELESIEALLLLERKRIIVKTEDGLEYDFQKLSEFFVNNIPNFWTKFLVYKDLRSRGYIVRKGFDDDIEFRVYNRGAVIGESNAKYLIHPIIEGLPIKLDDLAKITKIAKSSRKKLVLTVIDSSGELTYYHCKEVIF